MGCCHGSKPLFVVGANRKVGVGPPKIKPIRAVLRTISPDHGQISTLQSSEEAISGGRGLSCGKGRFGAFGILAAAVGGHCEAFGLAARFLLIGSGFCSAAPVSIVFGPLNGPGRGNFLLGDLVRRNPKAAASTIIHSARARNGNPFLDHKKTHQSVPEASHNPITLHPIP